MCSIDDAPVVHADLMLGTRLVCQFYWMWYGKSCSVRPVVCWELQGTPPVGAPTTVDIPFVVTQSEDPAIHPHPGDTEFKTEALVLQSIANWFDRHGASAAAIDVGGYWTKEPAPGHWNRPDCDNAWKDHGPRIWASYARQARESGFVVPRLVVREKKSRGVEEEKGDYYICAKKVKINRVEEEINERIRAKEKSLRAENDRIRVGREEEKDYVVSTASGLVYAQLEPDRKRSRVAGAVYVVVAFKGVNGK